MKDSASALNRANTNPGSTPTPYHGNRAPVPFTSAGGEHDPRQSPFRPNPPSYPYLVNNPGDVAIPVEELNDND